MKMRLLTLSLLFLSISLVSCTTLPKRLDPKTSLLAYKVSFSEFFSTSSKKCSVLLHNLATKEVYETQYYSRESGYSFVAGVPDGKYQVIRLIFEVYDFKHYISMQNQSTPIVTIKGPKVYYLGSYQFTRHYIPHSFTSKIEFDIIPLQGDDYSDLEDYLVKYESGWSELETVDSQKIFKADKIKREVQMKHY